MPSAFNCFTTEARCVTDFGIERMCAHVELSKKGVEVFIVTSARVLARRRRRGSRVKLELQVRAGAQVSLAVRPCAPPTGSHTPPEQEMTRSD